MKKAFSLVIALIMIAPLAFAALPASEATAAGGFVAGYPFVPAATTYIGTQYIVDPTTGVLTVWYGEAGTTWANCGLAYNGGATAGNYTASVELKLPEKNASGTQGYAAVAINAAAGEGAWYNAGLAVKILDYSNHPDPAVAAIGTCFEMYAPSTTPVLSNTGVTYQDANISESGWNTVSFTVTDGHADVYVNGVKILENYALPIADATGLILGTNGDSGVSSERHLQYRNLVFNNGESYFNRAYVSGKADTPWTFASTGNANRVYGGYFTLDAPAWAGSIIASTHSIPFSYDDPVTTTVLAPHQALYDDTGKDNGICYQFFAVTVASAPISGTPAATTPSCEAVTQGASVELRIVNTLADELLLYYYKNGVCVNGSVPMAEKTVAGVTAGGDIRITFQIVGSSVYLIANGTVLYIFTDTAADYQSGEVYIAYTASAYGINTTASYVVKELNGVRPNLFDGFTDITVYPFDAGVEEQGALPSDPAGLNWETVPALQVDGVGTSSGEVEFDADGNITLTSGNGWWQQATVVCDYLTAISQTSVAFNKEVFSDYSYNGYFGVFFTQEIPFENYSDAINRTYTPRTISGNVTGVMFAGDAAVNGDYAICALENDKETLLKGSYADGEDMVLTFGDVYGKYVNGEYRQVVRIAVNGENLYYIEDGVRFDYEFDVTDVLDNNGEAWLVLSNVGYGVSGGEVTVKKVNGYAAAYTDYKCSSYTRARILGAQYRTTGAAGLRFATEIIKSSDNGPVTIDAGGVATLERIAKYGTLLMPLDLLDGNPHNLRRTVGGAINGVSYLDVEGRVLYLQDDDRVVFTAVIIGIPDAAPGGRNYGREFVAVSYIEYKDGSIVYSNPCVRSIGQIATGVAKEQGVAIISGDGQPACAIMVPTSASAFVKRTSSAFKNYLNNHSSDQFSITVIGDAGETGVVSSDPEILIGRTDRAETLEVLASLPENSYAIKTVGNKIVIVGTSDALTIEAADYFRTVCMDGKNFTEKGLVIESNLNIVRTFALDGSLASYIRSGKEFNVTLTDVMTSPAIGVYYCAQGAASDGRYVYFVLRKKKSEEDYCKVTKHDLATGQKIAESEPLYLLHGNDMTYNPKTDKLIVSHCTSPEDVLVTIIDPHTLTVVEQSIDVGAGISSIEYNAAGDFYVGSQGQTQLRYFDSDLNLIKTASTRSLSGYTTQGMGSDDVYLYQPVSGDTNNAILVVTWAGSSVGVVYVNTTTESETLIYVNGQYYISFYKKSDGAILKRLNFSYK